MTPLRHFGHGALYGLGCGISAAWGLESTSVPEILFALVCCLVLLIASATHMVDGLRLRQESRP